MRTTRKQANRLEQLDKSQLEKIEFIIGKKNTLFIRVSNPMLKEEISYSKNKIIELINCELKQDIVEKIVLL